MTITETIGRRRRRGGVSTAAVESAELFLRSHSNIRGVTLDRLDAAEQAEVVALVHKVTDGIDHGTNFSRLSESERGRYEALLEQAGGLDPGTFAREREAATLRARAAGLARRALRPLSPKPGGEAGLFAILGDHLARNILHADHVAVLAVVLPQLLRAEPLPPGARIDGEDDEATLVVDRRYGIVGLDRDPQEMLSGRWEDALEHLARNSYLDVEQDGPNVRIRLGRRTRRALWGRSS